MTKTEKSLDKSEMEKKENVGINSETRQIGVLKGFDEQDCFKKIYSKISEKFRLVKIQKWPVFAINSPDLIEIEIC